MRYTFHHIGEAKSFVGSSLLVRAPILCRQGFSRINPEMSITSASAPGECSCDWRRLGDGFPGASEGEDEGLESPRIVRCVNSVLCFFAVLLCYKLTRGLPRLAAGTCHCAG